MFSCSCAAHLHRLPGADWARFPKFFKHMCKSMHPFFPYLHCTCTRSLQTPFYTRNGLYFMKLRQNWYSPLLYPECSFFRSTKCFFNIDLVFYSRTRCLGNGYLSGLWNSMSWWCILYLWSTTILCFSRPVIGKQSLRGCYQQASRKACLVSSACFPQQFGSFLEFNFLNDRFSLDTEMMVCMFFSTLWGLISTRGDVMELATPIY